MKHRVSTQGAELDGGQDILQSWQKNCVRDYLDKLFKSTKKDRKTVDLKIPDIEFRMESYHNRGRSN